MKEVFLIELIDGSGFFSEKLGRDWGSPGGGWARTKADATRFDTHALALACIEGLGHMAQQVRAVPHILSFASDRHHHSEN